MSNENLEVNELSSAQIALLTSAKETKVLENEITKLERWLKSRQGSISNSNFHKLISLPKSKAEREAGDLGQTAKSYILTIVSQILGAPNKEMDLPQFQWGKKYEPYAVAEYEEIKGTQVLNKGEDQKFLKLNSDIGGTPDGLIGTVGGLEIKCPSSPENHLKALLLENLEELKKMNPLAYWQSIGGLLITGRKYWDFMSYYHFFEPKYRSKIIHINREDVEDDILTLQNRLSKAVKYKNEVLKKINYAV